MILLYKKRKDKADHTTTFITKLEVLKRRHIIL